MALHLILIYWQALIRVILKEFHICHKFSFFKEYTLGSNFINFRILVHLNKAFVFQSKLTFKLLVVSSFRYVMLVRNIMPLNFTLLFKQSHNQGPIYSCGGGGAIKMPLSGMTNLGYENSVVVVVVVLWGPR
jgi:hypothetical protein